MVKLSSKKGVSEIISYVLILGLAVTLGAIITVWYQSTTEKQSAGIINPIEGTSQCQEVNVNAAFDYANCAISVYNTGSSLIDSFRVTYSDDQGKVNVTDYKIKIPPRLSQPIQLSSVEGITRANVNRVSITPIVIVSKQPYYCTGDYSFQAREVFTNCGE